jgi:hypothetical protein
MSWRSDAPTGEPCGDVYLSGSKPTKMTLEPTLLVAEILIMIAFMAIVLGLL